MELSSETDCNCRDSASQRDQQQRHENWIRLESSPFDKQMLASTCVTKIHCLLVERR